jgi:ABC-type spermidine/putrescine transport system permease subunit II
MVNQRTSCWRWAGWGVLAVVLALMYVPVAMVFVYSFNASRLGSVWTGFSTRWYGELFQRRDLWEGLRTSVIIGLAASTLSVALGSLAAMGLRRWQARSRRLAQGVLTLPLVVPDMIMAVALGLFFHALGVRKGMVTVILAHVSFGLSYAYVVVAAAVQDLDEDLEAAALDCGATPWQTYLYITAPILTPSLIVAWLLVFALSFDDFLITFFSKGPGGDTLPIKIYARMRFGVRPDTNALFVLLFLGTMVGVAIASRAGRRGLRR